MTSTRIFENDDTLFTKAAELIVKISGERMEEAGKFSLVLSGGNTPRKLYELLASETFSGSLNWKKIFIFWGDERCVPFTDTQNNSRMAMETLLTKVPIPAENIFRIPVDKEPSLAAQTYEQTIRKFFFNSQLQFDLVLLGLGNDGHTASLFPGTEILENKKDLVKEVYHEASKNHRISFTIKLINHARNILFLVTGAEKAGVLTRVLKAKDPSLPASLVKPEKGNKVFWYIDKAAASEL
jgi:6-phosphogluconolactonase